MEKKQPWKWKLTVPQTVKMMLVRPPMTNFKMTVRADCSVSACSALPLSIRALDHWSSAERESAFGQMSTLFTLPLQLPASEIKQTFLSTNLASLTAFEWQAPRSHLQLHWDPSLEFSLMTRSRFFHPFLLPGTPSNISSALSHTLSVSVLCWFSLLSCVWLLRPMDCIARQAPLSMGFFWQEYWSGLPFPSPGDFSHSGIEPGSPTLGQILY